MKIHNNTIFVLIAAFNILGAEIFTIKVKTTPEFPASPPPQKIIWEENKVGTTDPGKSTSISIDITKRKGTLAIGETKICTLWKEGSGFTGEFLRRGVKMKKNGTIVIKYNLSQDEILTKAMDFFPVLKENLTDTSISPEQKLTFNRLFVNILNYEFTTGNIVSSVTGVDPAGDLVYLEFSYFGLEEKTWNDTLKLTVNHFSGKTPKKGSRAQIFSDYYNQIPKAGVLKINRPGELIINSVKTEKYKWGTYKKKGKKKKKHILPITFFIK